MRSADISTQWISSSECWTPRLQYQPSEPSESRSQPDYVRNAPARRMRTPGGQHQIPKDALPVLSRRISPASSTSACALAGPPIGPALGGGLRQMPPIVENLLEAVTSLDSSARVIKPRAVPQTGVNGSVAATAGHLVAIKLEVFQQPPQPRQLLFLSTRSYPTLTLWMRCSRAKADVEHHWAKCSTTRTGPSVRDRYAFELPISYT